MEEKYLTLQEVAVQLKIGKSTLYRRIADGTLPKPIEIGHLRRFKKSDLDAALNRLNVA